MKKVMALVVYLFLILFACIPPQQPAPVCPQQIGLIEQALADARNALAMVCPTCSYPNAVCTTEAEPGMAVMRGDYLFLCYDREEMMDIVDEYGYEAVVGVFAHELGHIIDWQHGDEATETSADLWGGCALGILGLSLAPIESYLMDSNVPGGRYPTTKQRHKSYANGWLECHEIVWGAP